MGGFLAICNFVFSSSISNLVLSIFFSFIFFHLQALGRAQIRLTVLKIFENSTEGNVASTFRKHLDSLSSNSIKFVFPYLSRCSAVIHNNIAAVATLIFLRAREGGAGGWIFGT